MVTLSPWLVSTCSYQCFLSNFTPVSLHMLKCSCADNLSCLFMYCSFASIGHADIMCSISPRIATFLLCFLVFVDCSLSLSSLSSYE
jgi:hypothetical protein